MVYVLGSSRGYHDVGCVVDCRRPPRRDRGKCRTYLRSDHLGRDGVLACGCRRAQYGRPAVLEISYQGADQGRHLACGIRQIRCGGADQHGKGNFVRLRPDPATIVQFGEAGLVQLRCLTGEPLSTLQYQPERFRDLPEQRCSQSYVNIAPGIFVDQRAAGVHLSVSARGTSSGDSFESGAEIVESRCQFLRVAGGGGDAVTRGEYVVKGGESPGADSGIINRGELLAEGHLRPPLHRPGEVEADQPAVSERAQPRHRVLRQARAVCGRSPGDLTQCSLSVAAGEQLKV